MEQFKKEADKHASDFVFYDDVEGLTIVGWSEQEQLAAFFANDDEETIKAMVESVKKTNPNMSYILIGEKSDAPIEVEETVDQSEIDQANKEAQELIKLNAEIKRLEHRKETLRAMLLPKFNMIEDGLFEKKSRRSWKLIDGLTKADVFDAAGFNCFEPVAKLVYEVAPDLVKESITEYLQEVVKK